MLLINRPSAPGGRVRLNWPILDERMTFYHYQEFYPSLENTKNYFLTMDNGVRFRTIRWLREQHPSDDTI